MQQKRDHVIIAGYGVGGRFIAEFLQGRGIPFVIVEMNAETCAAQQELGLDALQGDIATEEVLRAAGVEVASVLALAIPDEQSALRATEIANAIHPDFHIIAGTRHTSTGMRALQKGADEVIVAEQAVAREFYRRIERYMNAERDGDEAPTQRAAATGGSRAT